jgi:SAM-dependent methyltransferase
MDSRTALVTLLAKGVGIGRRLMYGEGGVFLSVPYGVINKARLDHLASLSLGDLSRKSVLEVGAGIGLLTKFFEDRNCSVVSTDGNPKNVKVMRRMYPWCKIEHLDLDQVSGISKFGQFDIIFCYGTLYHLSKPQQALKALSSVCREKILLETCVSLGRHSDLIFIREPIGTDQAISGVGCRPTRQWVMEALREYWGHAYITRTQPSHPQFPADWDILSIQLAYRAVFVGSKHPLRNPDLLEEIPEHQRPVP